MSKIHLKLSYKNIMILKHTLEKKVERHERMWGMVEPSKTRNRELYEEYLKEEKENEARKRCLEMLEMAEYGNESSNSKIDLRLTYENILISKQTLQQRIEHHEEVMNRLRERMTPERISYELYLKEEKECEAQKHCLKALICIHLCPVCQNGHHILDSKETNTQRVVTCKDCGSKYVAKVGKYRK